MRINNIKFKASQTKNNLLRTMREIHGQRVVESFYYAYLKPENVGRSDMGWLMMAHEKQAGEQR